MKTIFLLAFIIVVILFPKIGKAAEDLKIKVIVDESYKNYFLGDGWKEWENIIEKSFEISNREFRRQFDKKIVVSEIKHSKLENPTNPDNLHINLANQFYDFSGDFIIVFTAKSNDFNGLAFINDRFVIIFAHAKDKIPYTLLHEIGHLCGAKHVPDFFAGISIMTESIMTKTFNFDAENYTRIKNGRCLK